MGLNLLRIRNGLPALHGASRSGSGKQRIPKRFAPAPQGCIRDRHVRVAGEGCVRLHFGSVNFPSTPRTPPVSIRPRHHGKQSVVQRRQPIVSTLEFHCRGERPCASRSGPLAIWEIRAHTAQATCPTRRRMRAALRKPTKQSRARSLPSPRADRFAASRATTRFRFRVSRRSISRRCPCRLHQPRYERHRAQFDDVRVEAVLRLRRHYRASLAGGEPAGRAVCCTITHRILRENAHCLPVRLWRAEKSLAA